MHLYSVVSQEYQLMLPYEYKQSVLLEEYFVPLMNSQCINPQLKRNPFAVPVPDWNSALGEDSYWFEAWFCFERLHLRKIEYGVSVAQNTVHSLQM